MKETLEFTAMVSGTESDEYSLTAGVLQPETGEYVSFQRCVTDGKDDEGVYFEFNDQSNGWYNEITSCRVFRNSLTVALNESAAKESGVCLVHVELKISDVQHVEFVSMLKNIFRNTGSTFRVEL